MRFCEVQNCSSPVFGTCKKSRKGYCKSHQYRREDFDKRSIVAKAIDKAKNNSKNLLITPKLGDNGKIHQAEMDLYWLTAERELSKHPYCMECVAFIPKKYYRAATAHIFPKNIFKSVMAHPLNRLFLGSGCGCHQKTERLDTFSKMEVFQFAIERFAVFEHLITEKHKYLTLFISIATFN